MIKKIVYIMAVKYFENKDWKQFGCQYLLDKGYDIEIWSFVKIYYHGRAKEPLHLFKDYSVKYFENMERFKSEVVKNRRKETIFIIYPSLGEDDNQPGYAIRWIIKKAGYQYCDYFYPPCPSYVNDKKNIPSTWAAITKYYLNNYNKSLFRRLIFSLIAPPVFNLVPARAKLCELANKYDLLKKNKNIYINTFDYDEFITENSESDVEFIEKEGLKRNFYIVYADQALTHHSDVGNAGLPPCVTEQIYQKEICRFFAYIEQQTGMEIVIALHPKAEYQDSGIFGNRKMIHGKSRILIKYCNFVITYCSTVISYAVLYKKKILFYYTEELLKNDPSKDSLWIVIKFLGYHAVNISGRLPDNFLNNYVKAPSEEKRRKYIDYYVTANRKRNIYSYQLIDKYLKCINRS